MELVYQLSSLEGPLTFMFFTSKKLGTLWHDIYESVYFFVLKISLKKIEFFFVSNNFFSVFILFSYVDVKINFKK